MLERPKTRKNADANQIAKAILDAACGEYKQPAPLTAEQRLVRELGRRGGLKGGKARVKNMSKAQLKKSAQKAAKARWSKEKN